jgi:hypothetical protein
MLMLMRLLMPGIKSRVGMLIQRQRRCVSAHMSYLSRNQKPTPTPRGIVRPQGGPLGVDRTLRPSGMRTIHHPSNATATPSSNNHHHHHHLRPDHQAVQSCSQSRCGSSRPHALGPPGQIGATDASQRPARRGAEGKRAKGQKGKRAKGQKGKGNEMDGRWDALITIQRDGKRDISPLRGLHSCSCSLSSDSESFTDSTLTLTLTPYSLRLLPLRLSTVLVDRSATFLRFTL